MANATVQKVDLADVEQVLKLEAPLRYLLEMIDRAWPAIDRLMAARYPGCDDRTSLKYDLECMARNLLVGPERRPTCGALHSLERLRVGEGDQAAIDYLEFVIQKRMELNQAVCEIIDRDDDVDRVEAFIRYAKTQVRP
ncbi:MAG: hypothetical protein ACHQ0J_10545 [Candidatus Dormibacterales bacterium]